MLDSVAVFRQALAVDNYVESRRQCRERWPTTIWTSAPSVRRRSLCAFSDRNCPNTVSVDSPSNRRVPAASYAVCMAANIETLFSPICNKIKK